MIIINGFKGMKGQGVKNILNFKIAIINILFPSMLTIDVKSSDSKTSEFGIVKF